MRIQWIALSVLVSLMASVCFGQGTTLGQSQVYTVLPDFAVLNTAADPAQTLAAYKTSLQDADAATENPSGLTVSGALDILKAFDANLDIGIPCDVATRAIAGVVVDLVLPYDMLLRAVVEDNGCDDDGVVDPGVIDEIIKEPGNPFDGYEYWCIEVDVNDECIKWVTTKPCDIADPDPDCECILEDDNGDCILWSTPIGPGKGGGGGGGGAPGVDPGVDPGIDPGEDPGTGDPGGDPAPPPPPGNGPPGGSNPSSSGVTSTSGGSCNGADNADRTSPNGANQMTENPLMRSKGFKYEEDVDLFVSLPGRDFVLKRSYTAAPITASSKMSWMIGSGWSTTADGWMDFTPHGWEQPGEYTLPGSKPDYNGLPAYLTATLIPVHNSMRFYEVGGSSESKVYKPGQALSTPTAPTKSQVKEIATTIGSETGVGLWRLESPGNGYTDFFRYPTGSLEYLHGRIYRQVDGSGNIWNYEYIAVLDTNGDPLRARLRRIYLNGSTFANSDAVVEFAWDIGTPTNPGTGLLREIITLRPHTQPNGGTRLIATQYVKYTYASDDFNYYSLVAGDVNALVLVESGSLVNAPVPGEAFTNGSLDDMVYHRRYTHFRYDQSIHIKRSIGNGAYNRFNQGVLTHRYEPEQVEYFAEQWLGRPGAQPDETLRDAVEAMMLMNTGDLVPFGDPTDAVTLRDFASKVISYNNENSPPVKTNGYSKGELAFKVSSQLLQSACGCSSTSSYAIERYDYAKQRFIDGNVTVTITSSNSTVTNQYYTFRNSIATTITESSYSGLGDPADPVNSTGVRETTSWSEEHTIVNGFAGVNTPGGGFQIVLDMVRSPFVVGNHVKDIRPGGTTLEWTSFHEFDEDNLLRARRYHPSAVESVNFDPATKLLNYSGDANNDGFVSALDAKEAFTLRSDDGFVEWWEYDNGNGQLLAEGVQRGENGTPIKVKEYEYHTSTTAREDLIKHEWFFADETGVVNDTTIEREYSYQTAIQNGVEVVTKKTTKVPLETEAQNGPPGSNNYMVTEEYFDQITGRPTRVVHPDGSETAYGYEVSGAITYRSLTDDWLEMERSAPGASPAIAPLTTKAFYDVAGRMRSMEGPAGVRAYTAYIMEPVETYLDLGSGPVLQQTNLSYLSVLSFPHDMGAGASPRFAGPMTQQWSTASMNVLRESKYELSDLNIDGSMPVVYDWIAGSEVYRSIHKYGPGGNAKEMRVWHDLDAPIITDGSYLTQFSYDALGRLNQLISPSGTVMRTTYDADDRVVRIEAGPDEQSLSVRSEMFYDHEIDGMGNPVNGVGEGNLTLARAYLDGSSTVDAVSVLDWRNRQRLSFTADNDVSGSAHYTTAVTGSASIVILDNLGRTIETATMEGHVGGAGGEMAAYISAIESGSGPVSLFGTTTGVLIRNHFNKRGMVYATEQAIDPADELAGFLRSESWFDAPGRLITSLSPRGPSIKTRFDALSRPAETWVTDGELARSGAAYNLITDTIAPIDYMYAQTETKYNTVSQPVMSISSRRNHSATELTGLGSNPITTYSATVYDAASRPIGSVSYGTNLASDIFESGGVEPSVPMAIPDIAANPDLIVSETVYDSIGRVHQSIDPEGRVTQLIYDDAGRTIATIQNYKPGLGFGVAWNSTAGHYEVVNRPTSNPDENRVSSMVYDGEGNTTRRVAHVVVGGNEHVQITEYDYDPSAAHTGNLANTYGNLYAIHYPKPGSGSNPYSDPTVGLPSNAPADTVRFSYNYFGEQILSFDQNGTQRAFARDELGRLTEETVQIFGAGVDTRVSTLVTEYDALGRVNRNESRDISGNSLDRVDYIYNALGDLQELKQYANASQILAGTPESIQWAYEVLNSVSGNEFRLDSMIYPDGSKLVPEYASTMAVPPVPADDNAIDRVREFTFYEPSATSGEMLVEYEHLGSGTVAVSNFGLYQMDRTADDQGNRNQAGKYPGWDRFGRLSHNAWVHSTWAGVNHTALQQTSFAYDRLSNRLEKFDLRLTASKPDRDWKFQYDELNRLIQADRGVFVGGGTTLEPGSRQWALDELGNWETVSTLDVAASNYNNAVDDDRVHNATNELIDIDSESSGRSYDDNGNLLSANGRDYIYDAWNRLVEVKVGNTTIAEYDYNSLHWRVAKRAKAPNGTDDMQRLMYYSPSWQLIYEDIDDTYNGSTHATARTALQVWGKRGGDDALYRAIDEGGDGTHDRSFRYVTDDQSSVVALIDEDGRVYERLRYDAYGNPEHEYPEDFDQSSGPGIFDIYDVFAFLAFYNAGDLRADLEIDGVIDILDVFARNSGAINKSPMVQGWISDTGAFGPDNRLGYTGFLWDAEAGLWLGRNRLYDPEAGRWLQRDPAGYVDGLSMYLYVRGNPLSYIDPMGLCADVKNPDALYPEDEELSEGRKDNLEKARLRLPGYAEAEKRYHVIKGILEDQGEALKEKNPELYWQYMAQVKVFEVLRTMVIEWGAEALTMKNTEGVLEIVVAYKKMLATAEEEITSEMMAAYSPQALIGGVVLGALVGKASIVFKKIFKKNQIKKKPKIPTIGGKKPRNSGLAGKTHRSGVKFTEEGFPDFSPHAKAEVEIEGLTGNSAKDSRMANKAAGFDETPDGYVWHHVEDAKTMQLVPQDIHSATGHTGGAAVIKNGGRFD